MVAFRNASFDDAIYGMCGKMIPLFVDTGIIYFLMVF